MLPPELEAPAPRDPRLGVRLLGKTRSKARGSFIAGIVLTPVLLALFWLYFGEIDGLSVGLSLAISGLVELFGVVFLVMGRRAEELFQHGTATRGQVIRLEKSGDEGHAYVTVHVNFTDAAGQVRHGQITTVARHADVDCPEGARVPVLYLERDPSKFAVYTPGLGLAPGVAR